MFELFGQYLVQFGIILFPIFAYQFWAFRKAFDHLPGRIVILALYGPMGAILNQLMPISIFGVRENFQCVPIILAMLYGKRLTGVFVVVVVSVFMLFTDGTSAIQSMIAMVVYSTLPFLICQRYEQYGRIRRLVTCAALSMITLMVQVLTLYVLFSIRLPGQGAQMLYRYGHFIAVAALIQFSLMTIATLFMENIVEDGRIRSSLLDSREALAKSEKRYRSLMAYNPSGICAFDAQGKFLMVNKAYETMTGYSETELLKMSRLELWFPENHHQSNELMAVTMRGEMTREAEFRLRHKSGHAIYVQVTNVPMVLGDGIYGFFSVVTDITEKRLTQELIRKSEKLSTVGQLAAGVAHEIRNPLTALQGFLKLLAEDQTLNLDYISIMQKELARIDLISGELLVLAKPTVARYQVADIHVLLESVIALMATQALMSNVEMFTKRTPEAALVWCEENQLKQVFINVLRNAIDAMPDGGIITVQTSVTNHVVEIRVRDAGVGMSTETFERLGEPFYTTKGTGTGLGLMVTHQIIERHQGSIDYSSVLGEGTEVSIRLPQGELPTEELAIPAESGGGKTADMWVSDVREAQSV